MNLDLLISALSFILVALVAGNNLPVSAGVLISGRIIRARTGLLIVIAGYIIGLLVQGRLLGFGFNAIMPVQTQLFVTIALAVSTVIFIATHFGKVIGSLGIALAATLLGISIAAGEAINTGYVLLMLLVWILAPVLSLVITAQVLRGAGRSIARMHIWKTASALKLALIALCFITAFSIGANTLGLVLAAARQYTSMLVMAVAVIAGSLLFWRGELHMVGDRLIPIRYLNAFIAQMDAAVFTEVATLFGIPIATSQVFTAGVLGAGLGYRTRVLLKKPVLRILGMWLVNAVVGFVLGYVITYIALGI